MSATASGLLAQLWLPVARRTRYIRRHKRLTRTVIASRLGWRKAPVDKFRMLETYGFYLNNHIARQIAAALGVAENELYPGRDKQTFLRNLGCEMEWLMRVPA